MMEEPAPQSTLPEGSASAGHKPYVPDEVVQPEFTLPAVLVGAVLGIIFGASSLYLVLKVGMTVSASIPVAVLSITLFRLFSRMFGFRRATILENNIVQTTGSAGESIAFGVGVTMPAVMLVGFDMNHLDGDGRLGAGRGAGDLDDDPAPPGVHRQAARHAALSRGDRLRRRADRGRAGRRERQDGVHRLRHRLRLPGAAAGAQALERHGRAPAGLVPEGQSGDGCRSGPDGRGLHHRHADLLHHGGRRRAGLLPAHSGDPLLRQRADRAAGAGHATHQQNERARHPSLLRAVHRRGGRGHGRHHQPLPGPAADLRLAQVGAPRPPRKRRLRDAARRHDGPTATCRCASSASVRCCWCS